MTLKMRPRQLMRQSRVNKRVGKPVLPRIHVSKLEKKMFPTSTLRVDPYWLDLYNPVVIEM